MTFLLSKQEKEFKDLFSPTLKEIKGTNVNIENSITQLMTQNDELTKKIEQIEILRRKDREYITLLEDRLEDAQRSSRKTNIEFKNVPKTNTEGKEDLINMVLCLGKAINCEIAKQDIRDVYRVREKKEGQKNTPIVVELSSTLLKTEILKNTKSHNRRYNSKLCAKHLGLTKNEDTPVFLAEQLTVKGSRLFFLARDLVKTKGYKFCWTSYGRVYVRKSENSPIILIKSENQIICLAQEA